MWVDRSGEGSKVKKEEGLTIASIGPPGSGKTHFYVLMGYHLLGKYTKEEIPYFEVTGYSETPEGAVSFHDLLWRLSRGKPLPPTIPPKKEAYKFLIKVKFPRLIGSKEIRMPLLDLSGEPIVKMMEAVRDIRMGVIEPKDFKRRMEYLGIEANTIEDLFDFVINADVFIHTVNLEKLYRDEVEISGYARFIDALRYLRNVRGIKKPMRHVLVFTFYDKIRGMLPVEVECGSKNYKCIADWLFNQYARTLGATGISWENKFISYTEADPRDPNKFKLINRPGGIVDLSYPVEEYDRILAFLRSCA